MEWILSWVKSGLLFGIFASIVLMLSPNKSYAKHISMIVGLLFILVMLHPVMELIGLDGSAYAVYIKNFLMLDTEGDEISENDRELYQDSVGLQLLAVLQENGYSVKEVRVEVDEKGQVERVSLVFDAEAQYLERLELYLRNLFGEEVEIRYEGK